MIEKPNWKNTDFIVNENRDREYGNHLRLSRLSKIFRPGRTISQRVVYSSIWLVALRISNRGLRVIRTIILARLLTPGDFGAFGIALLSLAALETFTESGFAKALIQRKTNVEKYLNIAWTIQITRGFILALTLYMVAPLISSFFREPEIVWIIRALGIAFLFRSFENVGIIYFRKELEFHKFFLYDFCGTIAELIIVIPLAFVLRNVWPLVFGYITANFVRFLMSYILHSYRPRIEIDWKKTKELFKFGKWVLANSIISFLSLNGDNAFVGKFLGSIELGYYQIAFVFSNFTAKEFANIIGQITFPTYSKLQDNIPKLRTAFLNTLEFTVFISVPVTFCILLLGHDFTRIFLGDKWMPMVPALQILSISGFIRSITATGGPLFNAVYRPNLVPFMNSARVIIMGIAIYPLTTRFGISGASVAVLMGVLATVPTWCYKTSEIIEVKRYLLYRILLPFLPGVMIIVLSILLLKQVLYSTGLFELLGIILVAGLSYLSYFIFLWKRFDYGPIKKLIIIKQFL
jgi:O-antigen/teichoic acid export membrane protein